jgi:hypothetical protein
MAWRILILALLALAQLVAQAEGARGRRQTPAPNRVTPAEVSPQLLAAPRRGSLVFQAAPDSGSQAGDCFAIEDADETGSDHTRAEGTRKGCDRPEEPGAAPFRADRSGYQRGSPSHPLIYQFCTLLI